MTAFSALLIAGQLSLSQLPAQAVTDCSSGEEVAATADELQAALIACEAHLAGPATSATVLVTADFNPAPSTVNVPSVYPIDVPSGDTLTIRSSTSDLRTLNLGGSAFSIAGPRMIAKTGTGSLVIERIGFRGIQGNESGQIIYVTAGDLTVTDSEFINNFSNGTTLGGAIYFSGEGTLTISGTTFSQNAVENTLEGQGEGPCTRMTPAPS